MLKYRKMILRRITMIKVGDIITFGKYEQDNNIQNGK
jgi:hypothetical protein